MIFAIVNTLKIIVLILTIIILINCLIELFKDENLKKIDQKHRKLCDIDETRDILWEQYIEMFHVEH